MYSHHIKQTMDQPGKVANPARAQLNREKIPFSRAYLRIWSRETGSAVPSRVSLLISILWLNLVINVICTEQYVNYYTSMQSQNLCNCNTFSSA